MTLRDIFVRTAFDDIVPYIMQDAQVEKLCHYKQAYDVLLHMEAGEEGCQEVRLSLVKGHDGKDYINAGQLEGCFWSSVIDSEVIIDAAITLPLEAIAYRLLWNLTFYGYSPNEMCENADFRYSDHSNNKYGQLATAIENKRYILWANKPIRKRIIASIKKFQADYLDGFSLPEKDWAFIDHHCNHCNGPKRKRDHRLSQRQKELENFDRCENTIRRLLAGKYSSVNREQLSFLWNKNGRIGTEFQTHAYDADKRLDYLNELIIKYGALEVAKKMNKCVVKLSSSMEYRLTREEISYVKTIVLNFSSDIFPIFIEAADDSLDCEIGVMIVGIEK